MHTRSIGIALIAVVFWATPPLAQSRGARATVHVLSSSADSMFARERANFRVALDGAVRRNIVSAAEVMPADKYGFAPTEGEFRNVRTFSRQIRHLAATNFILAAAALGRDAPADAGDEEGPDSVVTKAQHLAYLEHSFDALEKAIDAIGDGRIPVRSSPISPFQGTAATRISLIAEAMVHAYDHYGQMVVYLRMNGVIPPASRR
jgi:DinB family protein